MANSGIAKKPPTIPAAYVTERLRSVTWPYDKDQQLVRLATMLGHFSGPVKEAFAEVNGKASSFTLGSTDAIELAVATERRLAEMGVPKAARAGVIVTQPSAGPTANAYKYDAVGTRFVLRRNSKGDYILQGVERITVWPREAGGINLVVSPAARDAIVNKALEGIETLPLPMAA